MSISGLESQGNFLSFLSNGVRIFKFYWSQNLLVLFLDYFFCIQNLNKIILLMWKQFAKPEPGISNRDPVYSPRTIHTKVIINGIHAALVEIFFKINVSATFLLSARSFEHRVVIQEIW